jgi:hypothetical protein
MDQVGKVSKQILVPLFPECPRIGDISCLLICCMLVRLTMIPVGRNQDSKSRKKNIIVKISASVVSN